MPKDMHSNISQLFNNKSKQKKNLDFSRSIPPTLDGGGGIERGKFLSNVKCSRDFFSTDNDSWVIILTKTKIVDMS